MQIFVRTFTGRLLTINVYLFDSISVLKQKINRKIFLQPAKQMLIFNGKVLDDKMILREYSIYNEYTIKLYQVKNQTQSISKSKKQSSGKVHVQLPNGTVFSFDTPQEHKVWELKSELQFKQGFSKQRQKLLINDEQLEDHKKICQVVKNGKNKIILKLRQEQVTDKTKLEQLSKKYQQKQQELARQKLLIDQFRITMARDIADRDKRIKQLENNIEKMKKKQKEQQSLAQSKEGEAKRGRPKKQLQMNESFKGATFSELLKSKGIRDEILTLLIRHQVESTQILKECSEQILVQIGIPLGQVIILKKIKQL